MVLQDVLNLDLQEKRDHVCLDTNIGKIFHNVDLQRKGAHDCLETAIDKILLL